MKFLWLVCMVLLPGLLRTQDIPLGTWRTHLSYTEVTDVTLGDNQVIAVVSSGLFYIDLQDNSLNRLTELDGLQGGGIRAIAFDPDREVLLIGYATGNLDLVLEDRIINLDLISNSQVIGSKQINDILLAGAFAYLATDFGILKLDIARAEVRETYREIGPEGAQIQVHGLALYQDSLFLASPEGVRAGRLNEVNLADWRFWKDKPLPGPGTTAQDIASAGSGLFTAVDSEGLYRYENGTWTATGLLAGEGFRKLNGQENELIVVTYTLVAAVDPVSLDVTDSPSDPLIVNAMDGLRLTNNWWIADANNGLLSDYAGEFTAYSPSGPSESGSFAMRFMDDSLYVLNGGYSPAVQPLNRIGGVNIFTGGQWYTRFKGPGFRDMTDVAVMPGSGDRFYSSAGDGLLRVSGEGPVIIDENTVGSPLVDLDPQGRGLIIPGLGADNSGIWILNYGASTPLHYLDSEDQWSSFTIPVTQARFALQVLRVGDLIWLRIAPSQGGGLVVFDPGSGEARYLGRQPDNGSLPSLRVNDMALDKDGFLWLGTEAGVSVITNPFTLQGNINAVEPVFDGRPLLIDEDVRIIKVDGGNRKWMGTRNGAWLFDPSADEMLLRFTAANSPLPVNELNAIGIMGNTGEVFFGTDQGIVSYRANATEAGPEHAAVRIFPNPVRRDFSGTVGITGLVEDAEVKITDSAGRLIYRVRSNGGTATWNVDSENLQSGIYFVFSATADGDETFVGKIAVIR